MVHSLPYSVPSLSHCAYPVLLVQAYLYGQKQWVLSIFLQQCCILLQQALKVLIKLLAIWWSGKPFCGQKQTHAPILVRTGLWDLGPNPIQLSDAYVAVMQPPSKQINTPFRKSRWLPLHHVMQSMSDWDYIRPGKLPRIWSLYFFTWILKLSIPFNLFWIISNINSLLSIHF